jgi:cell wall-associated NlpC family hydrolase
LNSYRPVNHPYTHFLHTLSPAIFRKRFAAQRSARPAFGLSMFCGMTFFLLFALAPNAALSQPADSSVVLSVRSAALTQTLAATSEPGRSPADVAAEIIAAAYAAQKMRESAVPIFNLASGSPEAIASEALDHFRLELEEKISAISGPDSTYYEPFAGLKAGVRDARAHGPVQQLQEALLHWNAKLPLKANGLYDEATVKSLTLFKLVYDLGHDGSFVDQSAAGYLLAIEEGSGANLDEPQGITGRLVYHAAQFLGLRYRLGGDGKKSTDCGMLTRMAMIGAGLVDNVFNRVAATQYKYAEEGQMGLTLVDKNEEPAPGDLVFFKWNTRRARHRYKGITHVGIFLGKVGESLYVLEAHSARTDRKVTILDRANSIRRIAGYGRFTAPPENEPIDGSIEMTD